MQPVRRPLLFCSFLTGSAVFPHIDIVVKWKSIFCVSARLDADVFLFFFFTCLVKYFREKFPRERIRRIPFGLAFFILGRCLPKTRYHRDRLNFIKLVISVCFESLLGSLLLFYYLYRHKQTENKDMEREIFRRLHCHCIFYRILPFFENIVYTIGVLWVMGRINANIAGCEKGMVIKMKVILVNGSSRNQGCTFTALEEVARALREEGVETEHFFIGNEPLSDCIACGRCREIGKCVLEDSVNQFVEKAKECDGFVFGSPVYYAHPSGRLLSFMDRAFYSGKSAFAYKPAAAVLSARRAGTTASFDVINKYFTISSMPIVSSTYWNHVYGNRPEEVLQDKEGLMTMYNIGKNMAWLLKCIALGKENGVSAPENPKVTTNFIR